VLARGVVETVQMPLILQPTFSDRTREQIENHLLEVRARRMAAVVTYYAGVNAKNMHLVSKERLRVMREYQMLKRDLDRMHRLDKAIEERLNKIVQHQQELDFHLSNLVEIPDGDDEREKVGKSNGFIRAGRPPGG
jgi:hypothetical protein